ncbi:uncharacterized protein N7518_000758 [Penicillium psychrosexuale]|uniref:uncharacterized protein n=1 Tax=Penicillium psychrosexuale TaxID=1002107 RepID=UPI0025451A5F|nr:uncharacterized protein N7518_000758 [Penicillium psychrosexuale]KAJ5804455.1 hypothetical protein N7518_000758 [Penicillium psychrosexuale]
MIPLYALFLIPLVNGWTFRYTNATNATEIARGQDSQNCTNSPIGKEKLFTWDPEGSSLCVSIYRDLKCDSRAGYACGIWRKNASEAFAAFDVLPETDIDAKHQTSTLAVSTSTSATTSISTSSSVSSGLVSATPTESTAVSIANSDSGSSGPSLSGGAIAGIVVGVVAAVAIIVTFAVVLIRKRNKKNAAVANQHGGYGPHEADATRSSISGTTAVVEKAADSAVRPFRPPPGSKIVELVGGEVSAELGSSPISEMDGNNIKEGFNRF